MVAPLVAAGGRLVAGSARVSARRAVASDARQAAATVSSGPQKRQKSPIAMNRALRQTAEEQSIEYMQKELQALRHESQQAVPKQKKTSTVARTRNLVKNTQRKLKVATVHAEMALPLAGLYVVQLVGYFFYNFGEYILSYWIVDKVNTYIITLDWMWQVGWAIGTMAGLVSLLALALAYSAGLINWLIGWSPLILALCAALYFAPTLLVIPWVGLWMTVVFWTKAT